MPWRVVILTAIPPVAIGYAAILRGFGHEPVAIVSPRGSRGRMTPLAQAHVDADPPELDIVFAASKHSLARIFSGYDADLVLCTGFPWLLPAEAIEVPRLGVVNGHPSLLPRYRGPFPLAWAVLNGERETGLTYHRMDPAFDTGAILAQQPIPLADDETMDSLTPKLQAASGALLPIVLERLARGEEGEPQAGGDYQSSADLLPYVAVDTDRSAADVHRLVRAWSFVPPVAVDRGPILDSRRLLVTSLTDVD